MRTQTPVGMPSGYTVPRVMRQIPPAVYFSSAETLGDKTAPDSPVKTRREGPVAYITLSHPENANRLGREMISAIDRAFRTAEADPKVRQIVLESDNEKIFCPGADIFTEAARMKEIAGKVNRYAPFLPRSVRQGIAASIVLPSLRHYAMLGYHLNNRIERSPKITIAAIDGYAIGGGVELGLACDYIISSPRARYAIPETKYGIYPDWGATERLPQRIGKTLSKFIILEGGWMADRGMDGPATLEAEEALKIGMIDAILPSGDSGALQTLLREERFSQKRFRPVGAGEMETLDEEVRQRLVGTRFLEKYDRYRTASVENLLQNELKGLYPPTIRLTNRRIERGPEITRVQTETELIRMFLHMMQVMKRNR